MPAQATRWRSRRTWAAPIPLTERSRISLPNTPIRPSVTTRGSPTPCAPDSSPRDAMTGRIAAQSRRHSDQVLAPPLARPAVHPGAGLSSTSPCVPNLSDSDAASTIPTSATARYRQHTPRSRPLRPTGLAHQMCPYSTIRGLSLPARLRASSDRRSRRSPWTSTGRHAPQDAALSLAWRKRP